jgi:hypothetical protein
VIIYGIMLLCVTHTMLFGVVVMNASVKAEKGGGSVFERYYFRYVCNYDITLFQPSYEKYVISRSIRLYLLILVYR